MTKVESGEKVIKKNQITAGIWRGITIFSAVLTVLVLGFLIVYILVKGVPHLTPELFAWEYDSENVSMLPALINTLEMTILTLVVAIPFGIGSAIYLVEYASSKNRFVPVIRMTAETLTGIPSIVYGLFGMLFFNSMFGISMLSGALTLAIMVLPVIMRTTEEALLSVPKSYREGSFGLGAGKLRTIFKIVLPAAMPGIFSGIVLSIGRIVGETAALIYTAGTFTKAASSIFNSGRTLSVHMYLLSKEGLNTDQAYATAVVLLVLVIFINFISGRIASGVQKQHGEA
ncbi:MAG: phosphate ABC transporter permease PstA [bacterium]|nr:phosphate ABC transporter permease PstA [bacterium]MDY4099853.1 phosphate ABC transporter permease PstA [Lachnospiraceae bacterium]